MAAPERDAAEVVSSRRFQLPKNATITVRALRSFHPPLCGLTCCCVCMPGALPFGALGRRGAWQPTLHAATNRCCGRNCPFTCTARQIEVAEEGGAQVITATTDLEAGRLLLHWGLEGGKDYKGGWRLPGDIARPEGTRQYKDRALQTPFK